MNNCFSFYSAAMRRMASNGLGEIAMNIASKLFPSKIRRPRFRQLDDHLLCDIGLSRVEIEYRRDQATEKGWASEAPQKAEATN
jgi:hypothetical protein